MADAITVHCPSCETAFPVDPEKVPTGGVNARCSECSDIFRVDDPQIADTTREPDVAPGPGAVAPAPDEIEATEEVSTAEDTQEPASFEPHDYFFSGESADTAVEMEEMEEAEDVEMEEAEDVEVEEAEDVEVEATEAEVEPTLEVDAEPVVEAVPEAEPDVEPAIEEESGPGEAPARPAFGSRTPEQKAQRLARVLVSDMITYNPQMYERALEGGTLKDDFDEEIEKSWEEYVDQVGRELAESTSYWTEALNDILAKGDSIF